jgi:hypothetical protein
MALISSFTVFIKTSWLAFIVSHKALVLASILASRISIIRCESILPLLKSIPLLTPVSRVFARQRDKNKRGFSGFN